MTENNFDFVAIGDIVVDAFIRLEDAHVNCKIDKTSCELCMDFGSKVPYESVTIVPAVGNSPNAAVSAAKLGLKTSLVTFLGNDVNGRECKFNLENANVNTDFVDMQNGKITNYHYVLWFQDERTILIKHETFKCHMPDIGTPKWIYLSSIGEHAKDLHFEIANYIDSHPGIKLAFQPGTFQIKMGAEALAPIYKHTEFFCVNVEEAQKILNLETHDLPTLLSAIQNLGPKIVCITDGPNGAYMREGDQNYFMPIYPDEKPPYERTGAGDAFTSAFTAALGLGLPATEALRWAPVNSMNVVQYVGAQKGLLTRKEIEDHLAKAPSTYQITKI